MTPAPDPSPITTLITAFRQAKTLFAAVELGVFDRLHESPQTVAELAQATRTHPGALERLLNACCAFGFATLHDGTYRNTEIADLYLRAASPQTLTGYILYSNRVLYPMWSHLEDAVRDGSHRWRQTFGFDGPIFSHFFESEQSTKTFLSGMHGYGLVSSPSVVRIFNLNRFRRLVDLGGGTGHLAICACERYGNLRAAVFDLPDVVGYARPYVDASPARGRLDVIAGDFFVDPLPPADLYACGRILHDWSETRIQILLKKVYDALPPGGAFLIMEALLDDDACGPLWPLMQSLNMLVCTEGQERTAAGYRRLLEDAGFVGVEARRTGAPHDAVLALKPAT